MRIGKLEQEIMDCLKERGACRARDIASHTGRYRHERSFVIEASLTAALKRLVAKGCIARSKESFRGNVYVLLQREEATDAEA